MQKRICIIGGSGEMGQMTQNIFSKFLPEYALTIFDESDWQTPEQKLANQDIIILSVPIYLTDEIIKKTIPYLSEGTILADYTSIKKEPLDSMLANYDGPVVGLHPIFGPTISSPDNQVIVVCDGKQQDKYQYFIDDLARIGFSIEKMTAKEHDEAMTFIQGIEHFSVYCLGLFLKHKNVDIQKMLKLASPVYKMELNIVGRLFSQGPGLYADIIMSDKQRQQTIAQFAEFVNSNAEKVSDGDKQTFIENFKAVKEWMGDFAPQSYKNTDKLLLKKKGYE
ncbi:prephenate dehydrogenase family protein [Francisella philomiragia subsp. philomiragia ATCC 25015]|uniref:bifunctional chorismate mutase/prephenate dehydrogenase n=1 Tax=Francisella philomiragia TaxID=28110 RepID=UPI0001AF796C|nr:bifunctional chorismate mutase/prephenate dehydrogenase [Francisella philomiragia]AJI75871.1 prephenate dehydrogenase family protein [Francisella philomiragia subsp. philomiragia ATCC 25015]EET20553.1 prephenate dehydrogenase [Francisella philomiragia subsp. philomiragia ATCC 25015]MBK2237595.1 bifunctional chorismate mutase/prephenate dehydrogenase [Francisella philomiragia]